jgi:hypothetical protein
MEVDQSQLIRKLLLNLERIQLKILMMDYCQLKMFDQFLVLLLLNFLDKIFEFQKINYNSQIQTRLYYLNQN